jgi:hypothetical protein
MDDTMQTPTTPQSGKKVLIAISIIVVLLLFIVGIGVLAISRQQNTPANSGHNTSEVETNEVIDPAQTYTFVLRGTCINIGGVALIDNKYYPDINTPCTVVAVDPQTGDEISVMATVNEAEWWKGDKFVLPAYSKIFLSKNTPAQRIVMYGGEGGGSWERAWTIDSQTLQVTLIENKSTLGTAFADLLDNAVSNDAYYRYIQQYRQNGECGVLYPTTGKIVPTYDAKCIVYLEKKDIPECEGIESGADFSKGCFSNIEELNPNYEKWQSETMNLEVDLTGYEGLTTSNKTRNNDCYSFDNSLPRLSETFTLTLSDGMKISLDLNECVMDSRGYDVIKGLEVITKSNQVISINIIEFDDFNGGRSRTIWGRYNGVEPKYTMKVQITNYPTTESGMEAALSELRDFAEGIKVLQ